MLFTTLFLISSQSHAILFSLRISLLDSMDTGHQFLIVLEVFYFEMFCDVVRNARKC